MKPAFSLVVVVFFLAISRGVVLATETPSYDFASLYEVQTSAGGAQSHFTSDHLTEITPEAGKEGEPSPNDLRKLLVEKKPTYFESLSEKISSLVPDFTGLVIPLQTGIHKASQIISSATHALESSYSFLHDRSVSFWSTLQSEVSSTAYQGVLSLSRSINTTLSFISNSFSSASSYIYRQIPKSTRVHLAWLGLAGMVAFAFFAKSTQGKRLLFIADAVLSAGDLILHGLSAGAAVVQSATTSLKFSEAYQENNAWIKRKLGRDIGEVGHDFVYGGAVIALTAIVVFAPAIGSKAGQIASRLTPVIQQFGLPATLYASKVGEETARECQIPGQCATRTDLALTIGINAVAQGLPFEGPAVAFKKSLITGEEVVEDGVLLTKTVSHADDVVEEVSSIGKVLNQTDEAALAFTRSDLEKRVGKDFVNEIFGDAQGRDFEKIAKKWPNALEFIEEGEEKGHIILKHYKKDKEFLRSRIIDEEIDYASSYNSKESLLNTIENTLNNQQNKNEITRWLNSDTNRTLTFRFESETKIGYILEKGKDYLVDSNRAVVVLKKTDKSFYILTSYVE